MNLKIRLADWRDREAIQPLRRLLQRPLDGGLYELLNWPIYHVHTALDEGRVIGFTSVVLTSNSCAEDVATIVHPDYRRQSVGSLLRATQARDLSIMGWNYLFCTVDTEDGLAFCSALMDEIGEPINIDSHQYRYFGTSVPELMVRLADKNIPPPYPLSLLHEDRLRMKAVSVTDHLRKLGIMTLLNSVKLSRRQEYIGGN